MTTMYSIQDIKEAVHKYDLLIHPYIIYCHPSIKDQLKEWLGNTQIIEDIPWIDKDKVYLFDRAKIEKENKMFFDQFVNYKEIGKDDEVENDK